MAATNQILIYSLPELPQLIDQSVLISAGYDVVAFTEPQAVETWLTTFLADDLLIIINPSDIEALRFASEILAAHPCLPIIIVTNQATSSNLKQALEIGIFDYLTTPVKSPALLLSVKRSLIRQNNWQNANRFNRVLADLEDGVILADLDGYLLLMNQSARNIFSIEEGQTEGKTVGEIFHHPDLLDIFKSQSILPRLTEISLEDGRVFSAQASRIPEIGIAVVMQEITHLKELDRIKTDFVNTVSHDLRSPLTAIYGFVSLIDRVGPINDQQTDFIRHIQSSVQHITSLINDLMDLGRVEADYDIQMEEVNLPDIINRCVENLDYQINEKMQEWVLSIPDDIPAILGNPLHLQRMVSNLLENAIKFTPPLGKISIVCRSETSQLILEVSDNGPGIPLADQPRIFDKFYRGSNLSQNIPGTGLGLSIVKSVVDKHHGRIWLESTPSGTTFTIILPLK
jgi:two-component system, OmpR family, phosphate regulon sensor histidine kinase PhoR